MHSAQHLELLSDMAYCPALARVAVGGGATIKVGGRGPWYSLAHSHHATGMGGNLLHGRTSALTLSSECVGSIAFLALQVLDVGAHVHELAQEAIELEHGALVDSLCWSKDGQVRQRG